MGRFKVVITDRKEYENIDNELRVLGQIGADVYDYDYRNEDDILRVASDCDALIIQYAKVTRRVVEGLQKCKVISKYATGLDGIDIQAASEKGICVTNVNDYCSDEVSTHALSLLLYTVRRLKAYSNWTASGGWFGLGLPVCSLKNSVVGVISFGKIARAYVEKLKPLCDEIWVYDRFVDDQTIIDCNVKPKSFDELIRGADYISIHAPLTEETTHMFNKDVFRVMKNTAAIINVARGKLICEEDLIWALNEGEISFAALDVLETEPPSADNPLLNMEKAVVTPHMAWYSVEAQQRLQTTAAENVARVLTGQRPDNLVNKELEYLFTKDPTCR